MDAHDHRRPLRGRLQLLHLGAGLRHGTGAWPGRRVGTYEESWAETYAIEPDRVREAARYIPEARRWMEQNGVR